MKKITKSALFYVILFALITLFMTLSWKALSFASHTLPAGQYREHPLTIAATVVGAWGKALADLVPLLLLHWGWLIYTDWKLYGYTRTFGWAAGAAAASLAVGYGTSILFSVPELEMFIKLLFIAMTAIALAIMAAALGAAQLWKNKKKAFKADGQAQDGENGK